MTLYALSSRSFKFDVKYFENGDSYDDKVNGSQIGNHPWGIHLHHDLNSTQLNFI